MPAIQVLEKSVAELIAAGEVVERPASVVKELVENSIDAGATDISVEISGGGVNMIRISDNGCGITREDIPKAFLRHATSKVHTADDLDGILTLGFRGEALASVAAMCRVELTTKTAGEAEGTSYIIEGGEALSCVPSGRPDGTTITVRDIFFNTPARMKFLKKDISEGNSVAQVIDRCALSHPEISFKFIRDGAVKLKTSGNGDLLAVIYEIYGREFAEEMLAVDYVYENFARVSGYISTPSGVKPSRSYQTFFINNRFVKTRTGSAAIEEAYKNKIMGGKFPACVLNLELDAATVDVNVHPAKIEVRFVNERPVFSAVYYAVKSALGTLEAPLGAAIKKSAGFTEKQDLKEAPIQQRLTAREFTEQFAAGQPEQKESVFAFANREKPLFSRPASMNASMLDISVDDAPFNQNILTLTNSAKIIPAGNSTIFNDVAVNSAKNTTNNLESERETADDKASREDLRVIGEAFGTYILLEDENGLLLVDKHAAHERIIYEKLKKEISYGSRQVLLTPQSVVLSRGEYSAVMENPERLKQCGFLVEDFGGNAVIVREIPIELDKDDISYILRDIADKLKNNANDLTPNALDRLYYNIACRSAVKARDKNSIEELLEIVKLLNENPSITHCPHGRPVLVRMSRRDIEKMFGRL